MTYAKGSPDKPEVLVNFRMSKNAHEELMCEVGSCGCNVSGFIRHAVMREIYDRRQRRKARSIEQPLAGQLEAFEGDDA